MCTEDLIQICFTLFVFLLAVLLLGMMGYAFYTDEYKIVKETKCLEYSPRNGKCVKEKYLYECALDGDVLFAHKELDKVNEFCEAKRSVK